MYFSPILFWHFPFAALNLKVLWSFLKWRPCFPLCWPHEIFWLAMIKKSIPLFFFHFSSNADHPATNLTLKYVKHHNWGLHDWVFFCQNCITSKPALLLNLLVYIRSHGNIHHILRRKPELCSSNARRSIFFLVYGYITKSRDALYMMYPEAGHSVCLGK